MTRTRRLLYGLLVTIVVLLAVEFGLRGSGWLDDETLLSPLLFQQLETEAAPLAPRDGWVFGDRGRRFHAQPLGLRVITLGGSATAGDGVTAFASFSHQLQRRLLLAQPGRSAEVINLGRGGVGSRQVAQLLELGLGSFHPQLAVVYAGNNEFHELRALKHASPAYGANLERTRRRLHGLHLYRALQRVLGRDRLAPFAPLGQGTPAVHELPTTADARDRALALQLYDENLTRMVRSAVDAGVPIILATVADNRAGWVDAPPGRSMTSTEERLLAEMDGLRMHRDTPGALAHAEDAWAQLHDERAFYRMGRVLLDLGQPDAARRFLDRAELVMARPNRSSTELRAKVREVATAEGAVLCDVATGLDARSREGIAGDELFVDACHPSPQGHAHIASLLAACAHGAGLLPAADWDAPMDSDPWRLDHHGARLQQSQPDGPQGDPSLDAALEGHRAYSAGDHDGAWGHYARALEMGGPRGALRANQGLVRWRQGRSAELEALWAEATVAAPDDPEIGNWKALLTR